MVDLPDVLLPEGQYLYIFDSESEILVICLMSVRLRVGACRARCLWLGQPTLCVSSTNAKG